MKRAMKLIHNILYIGVIFHKELAQYAKLFTLNFFEQTFIWDVFDFVSCPLCLL